MKRCEGRESRTSESSQDGIEMLRKFSSKHIKRITNDNKSRPPKRTTFDETPQTLVLRDIITESFRIEFDGE